MNSVNPSIATHVSGLLSFWQSIEHTAEAVNSDVKTVGDAIVHWISNNGAQLGEIAGVGLVVTGDVPAAALAVKAGSAAQALAGMEVSNTPVSVAFATTTLAQHVQAIATAAGNTALANHAQAIVTAVNSAGTEAVVQTSIAGPQPIPTAVTSIAESTTVAASS